MVDDGGKAGWRLGLEARLAIGKQIVQYFLFWSDGGPGYFPGGHGAAPAEH